MTERRDETRVAIAGAGFVTWRVLRWLAAAERFGVIARLDGDRLEFIGLPEPAEQFAAQHADELRRVVRAIPARVM